MGQRISYFKNNNSKTLKDLIFEHFALFRQWYLDTDNSLMEDFREPFGNENLKSYFKQGTELINDFDGLDKSLIDELTSEFICSYCDLTEQGTGLLEFFGPSMGRWRYEESSEMVLATKDQDLMRLWNYLTEGRSIKDKEDYSSYKNDYKIGFLSVKECGVLKEKIRSYFGDIEDMRSKYWTDKEKNTLKEAVAESNKGFYSLSDHNPISSGLEYVLEALSMLDSRNVEIVTGIE